MSNCTLQQLDNGKWWCEDCDENKLRLLPIKAKRNCRKGGKPSRPTMSHEELESAAEKLSINLEHIQHYAQALVKWRAAGYQTRTQAEVMACLRACKGGCGGGNCAKRCTNYTKNGKCRKCGCGVNASQIAVFNKAKMATEDCPEGKWPLNELTHRAGIPLANRVQ